MNMTLKRKNIHPFPARMAPEIALDSLKNIKGQVKVLDPMSGSGTVLRQAVIAGHEAVGYDMDPLAVIMSKAWTQKFNADKLDEAYSWLIKKAKQIKLSKIDLPWIDDDEETKKFVSYWFARPQILDLRKFAYVIANSRKLNSSAIELNILKVALSRLIVTKKKGASLAWDVSHSRPHRVTEDNDFNVFKEFEKSYQQIREILKRERMKGKSKIKIGDARNMSLKSETIDIVITSPPYLNAIDYLRGHKLALVWFGYSLSQIRDIRSNSVGAERAVDKDSKEKTNLSNKFMKKINKLPNRHIKMIERYAVDASSLMQEMARVLKPKGRAILVVGNSCLQNVYIENSKIFQQAALYHGLQLAKKPKVRKLPMNSRYLPLPKEKSNALNKRMRNEVIMEFIKVG